VSFIKIGRPPASFADPVGFLLSCHHRTDERLAALERAAAAGDAAAAEAHIGWLIVTFQLHGDDEEASLFPRLMGRGADEVIADLITAHRASEAILLAARTALAAAATDELRTHVAALAAAERAHAAIEEERLFPLARELPEAELRAIGIEMSLRRGGESR
jgi:hemerythrin HHE cation binding domain-containing protein